MKSADAAKYRAKEGERHQLMMPEYLTAQM
jgi:hypothetical protein